MTDEATATRGAPTRRTPTADPTLTLPGTWNARDTGGRAVPEGASEPLATGVLLRSASLSRLEPAGVGLLADHEVTTVLDLRGPREVARDGADVVPAGTQVLALPFGAHVIGNLVGAGADTSPAPARLGHLIMESIYRGFVTDPEAHAAIGTALTAVASSTRAVLVHCSAGKDRTGWIVALVQAVCSVPRDQILQEYLLSGQATGTLAAAMPLAPGVAPELWDAVLRVHPAYLAAAEDQVGRSFGSLTGYLDAIGVDAVLRSTLRARFGVDQA